jgi:hypothetical protein
VLYRETHVLLDELAEAVADGTRKEFMESLTTVPLLIIDDFGMRKLPLTAAEDLLEIVMRRYERASTLLTSNRTAMHGPQMRFLSIAAGNVLFGLCRGSERWLAAEGSYPRFGAPPTPRPASHPRSKDEAWPDLGCRPG